MDDREVVAAIAARNPAGIAAAYDKYAAALYGYCRWMLRQPTDAAEALWDTFVMAAATPGDLPKAPKLRPWLYSVARRECKRRLQTTLAASHDATAGRPADETQPIQVIRQPADTTDQLADQTVQFRAVDHPPDPTDQTMQFRAVDQPADTADGLTGVSDAFERAELQALIHAVLAELEPREREVAELTLRHDLHDGDLAIALGVSWSRAHTLAAHARGQVEKALGALLIARTGREACPELDALLADWDGQLTQQTRDLVSRHVNECETCTARKLGALRPGAVSGLLPLAELPPGLREQILTMCSSRAPNAVADDRRAAQRAEPIQSTRSPAAIVIVLSVLLLMAALYAVYRLLSGR